MKKIIIGFTIILISIVLFRLALKEIKLLKGKNYDMNDDEYYINKSGDFAYGLSAYAAIFASIGLLIYGAAMIYFEIERIFFPI
jgi:hypothetical protein